MTENKSPDLIDKEDDHGRDNLRTKEEVIEDVLVKENRKQKILKVVKRLAVLDWFVLGTVFYILFEFIRDIKHVSGTFMWISVAVIAYLSVNLVWRTWKTSEEKPKEVTEHQAVNKKIVRWVYTVTPFIMLIIYLFPETISNTFEDMEVDSIGFQLFIYLICYVFVLSQEQQSDKKKGIKRPFKWWNWRRALKALAFQLLVYALLFGAALILFVVTGGPRWM